MKNLLFISLLILTLVSCKKEPLEEYTNGGTLPEQTDPDKGKVLTGTTWVLTSFTKGFTNYHPNDTIEFVTKTSYKLNGVEFESYRYDLTQTNDVGNPFNLILYGFSPFGDNGNWNATLVTSFIAEGKINETVFDNKSSAYSIKANFKKIK